MDPAGISPLQNPPPEALLSDADLDDDGDALEVAQQTSPLGFSWPELRWPRWALPVLVRPTWSWPEVRWPQRPQGPWQLAATAALGAGVLAGITVLALRQPWRQSEPLVVQPPATPQSPAPVQPVEPKPAAQPVPLTVAEPSDSQIKALLDAWLAAKAAVLAGRDSSLPLAELARTTQVQRLEAERSSDAARGETQRVEASITNLEVLERSPNRLAVRVSLAYSDSRLDRDGTTIERTPPTTLVNRYVLARDGDTWRLAAFSRSS